MPELPEVETVVRGLRPVWEGRRITALVARRPDLRRPIPPDLAQMAVGRRIDAVERRAKYILARLEGGVSLVLHLGMSGRLLILEGERPPFEPHEHVVFETEPGIEVRFKDPRRFGLLLWVPTDRLAAHPLFAGLGPEPLGESFDGALLRGRLARHRGAAIKAALLDQRVVAGIGNIYACEALFRSRIDPRRPAASLSAEEGRALAAAIRQVLAEAIEAGGSTLRDHVQPTGEMGYFQHAFSVYGREGEGCPGCDCGEGVRRVVQGGRSTFYCAVRQR